MANRARLKLSGLKELQRTLQRLPDELQPSLVAQAQRESLEPMRARAEELAPVDEGVLQDAIIISDNATDGVRERPDESLVYMGVDYTQPNAAPHGHLVEYGTGPRFHESGKYTGEMPAQPFIRPALDEKWKEVVSSFGPRLWKIIRDAARKLR